MKTWIPKRMEICDDPNGARMISKVFTVHMSFMLFIGVFMASEIPLFIKILTPREFWIPPIVAYFAVFSRVAFNSFYHLNFGLLYGRKTAKISIIHIVITALSVPMYYIFIKYGSIQGAFMASFVIYCTQAVLAYSMSKSYYTIKYDFKKLSAMFVSAIGLTILIGQINIQEAPFLLSLHEQIAPVFKKIILLIPLESLNKEKYIAILDEKTIYIIEGVIKGILTLSYLGVMVVFGVIDRHRLSEVIQRGMRKLIPVRLRKTKITVKNV